MFLQEGNKCAVTQLRGILKTNRESVITALHSQVTCFTRGFVALEYGVILCLVLKPKPYIGVDRALGISSNRHS